MQWRGWGLGLTGVLVLSVLAWCFLSPMEASLGAPSRRELVEPAVPQVAAPIGARSPRTKPATTISSVKELPVSLADSADVTSVGMPSHPITPERQRIYRENNLIGDLNGAMDVADIAGLRRLLQQYRDEYPEDAHVLQDGYELIADCLERLDPETRARAQRYYDEERDSGLRRYIRRHCLEAPSR